MKAHYHMAGLRSAVLGCLFTILLVATAPAMAMTIVAGVSFDGDAFADALLSSSDLAQFTVVGAASVEAALTGSDTNTWAFSDFADAFVELGFTDNLIVNGPGDDSAVFELSVFTAEDITVTINGIPQTKFQTDSTFDDAGIFVTLWDLDDFGIAPSGTASSVILQGECHAIVAADSP